MSVVAGASPSMLRRPAAPSYSTPSRSATIATTPGKTPSAHAALEQLVDRPELSTHRAGAYMRVRAAWRGPGALRAPSSAYERAAEKRAPASAASGSGAPRRSCRRRAPRRPRGTGTRRCATRAATRAGHTRSPAAGRPARVSAQPRASARAARSAQQPMRGGPARRRGRDPVIGFDHHHPGVDLPARAQLGAVLHASTRAMSLAGLRATARDELDLGQRRRGRRAPAAPSTSAR